MPYTKFHDWKNVTLQPSSNPGGKGRGSFRFHVASVLLLVSLSLFTPVLHAATDFNVIQAPGGIAISGGGQNYSSSFGTMNALGVGAPTQAGVSVIQLNTGALYYTTFDVKTINGIAGAQTAYFQAAVTTTFAHPAAFVMETCPSNLTCNVAGNFSATSTNVGAPTTVVPAPGLRINQTATIGLAIFIADNDGAAAYTGTDTATLAIGMFSSATNTLLDFAFIALNNPVSETVQTAVRLNLATDPSGLTVSPAADYSMNFGNVNALGIGPGAGLTTVAAGGGIIYSTPYQIQPSFTAFTQTTATVKVYASTDFVHPVILHLDDAAASAGPYNAISKNAGAQTQISNAFTNRSTNTRYLGLFISNANGAGTFTGTDNATLTYTLTVP